MEECRSDEEARWTLWLRLKTGSLESSHVVIDRFSKLIDCECVRREVRANPEYIPPHEAQLYDDIDAEAINDPTRFCADLEYRLPTGEWSELVFFCLVRASRAGRGSWQIDGDLERHVSCQCHVIKDSGIHHAMWMLNRGGVESR